tara:strand:+ start:1813 stop:2013 length:201 start_codon:yes stop_codon:yes gene_type:complete
MALKINDNGTDREMTANEAAEYKAWQVVAKAESEAEEQNNTARAATRQAALTKLGLTADEAAALFG